jgi:nitrogenase subunit NifH
MPGIAIYGKGGIGKSTIAANISAVLGRQGKKVLQVGCDPKHDSTRLLLGGRRIKTVLEYLRERSPDQCRLSDIVHEGAFGVHCIEAGGPEPGEIGRAHV